MKMSVVIQATLLAGMLAVVSDLLTTMSETRQLPSLMGCVTLMTISLMWIVHSIWLVWHRVSLEPEPTLVESWGELIGDPQFDPERGIYASVLVGSVVTKVVIQPKWWNYFSPTLIRSEEESACLGSQVTTMETGTDPKWLVVLQNARGETKGMGCRAKIGNSVVLLTAYHLVKSTDELYIAKYSKSDGIGRRVRIEGEWEVDFYSHDSEVDVVGVKVPNNVWSSLGVGVINAQTPSTGRKACMLFGAESSKAVKSSSGIGFFKSGFTGTHGATTAKSWSGSPVVSKGCVIGVHKGSDKTLCNANVFTVIHPSLFPVSNETMYDHGHIQEIDLDEADSRPYDFKEADIHGRGLVGYSEHEYYTKYMEESARRASYRGRKITWSDLVEDDNEVEFSDALEAQPDFDFPLNFQGAVSECSSPLKSSETTNTVNRPLSESMGCPSLRLEDRVSNLEKLLEHTLASMLSLQEVSSQNSKILTGLNAEALRNSIPSCSKQPASDKPTDLKTSTKQSKHSCGSTQEVSNPPASQGSGIVKGSKRRSKRSRKQKSKLTPHQESPSQS